MKIIHHRFFVEINMQFPCVQCGKCCQNVNLSEETRYLDRNDGTCKYFEESTKRCSIYHERPDICRVDVQYQQRFVRFYTWEEYVDENLRICKMLMDK